MFGSKKNRKKTFSSVNVFYLENGELGLFFAKELADLLTPAMRALDVLGAAEDVLLLLLYRMLADWGRPLLPLALGVGPAACLLAELADAGEGVR